jgi:hypothetical protein
MSRRSGAPQAGGSRPIPLPPRVGGAARPDAVSGINSGVSATALLNLYAERPARGAEASSRLTSAFRDHATGSNELWDASDKTGKMVAKPGTSKHESGYCGRPRSASA